MSRRVTRGSRFVVALTCLAFTASTLAQGVLPRPEPAFQGKIGRTLRGVPVFAISDLRSTIERTGAEIAVLTVPAAAAIECYDALAAAGVRAVLNFAPVSLPGAPRPADSRT